MKKKIENKRDVRAINRWYCIWVEARERAREAMRAWACDWKVSKCTQQLLNSLNLNLSTLNPK